ncbi:hypothetical protein KE513_05215 [Oscillospiraceae bacterium Marseille-Q3528]|nr:hypothetical protein [Oscillospiraceae bacterium Marseille-Q3528]
MADVSVEALQKVKSALTIFQSDITGISSRVTAQAQNCLEACYRKVNETQTKIDELDSEIAMRNTKISDLDSQIHTFLGQIQQLENSIPRMEKQLQDIENNITNCQRQLSSLQAQLADDEDDGTRQQLQVQIGRVTQQLNSLYCERSALECEIRNSEKQKDSLHQKVSGLKSEKARCEESLLIAQKRRSQYQQKFDQLKSLLEMVKANLDDYIRATRRFENSSSASAGQNMQAIDRCITQIEEYLSTIL